MPTRRGPRDRAAARISRVKPVVLLVHPHADLREMYMEFFGQHQLTTIALPDGDAALGVASRAQIIVTGIRIDGSFDGIELIRRLRHDARTKDTPIIVASACAMSSDRERAADAGCDAFLPLPCLPDDLLHEIHRLLAQRRQERPTRPHRS